MDDTRLLELAGKAAGEQYDAQNNPLERDDLALRLAVKLAMYVALDNAASEVVACAAEGDVVKELVGNDPYAATRRAIVRAAAEIWRQHD